MTTWAEIFSPMESKYSLGPRPAQAQLGNAIIDTFNTGECLVAQALVGTGKSFAALVPMINKILDGKKEKKIRRGVVSTETTALQNQYFYKDLPALAQVYSGFTYANLMGRSHYACFVNAKTMARGNPNAASLYQRLDRQRGRLVEGTRKEAEKVLGTLSDHEWSFLSGTRGCSEHGINTDDCYSDKARAKAAASDIVVVNHALLRIDAESREDDFFNADNFLGPIDYLVVDEAHTLEQVLVDGWTEELSEWEILEKTGKVYAAIDFGLAFVPDGMIQERTRAANEGVSEFLKSVTRFFELRHKDIEWKQVVDTISLKYIKGADRKLISAMESYEITGLANLELAQVVYGEVLDFIEQAINAVEDAGVKGKRELGKGRTAAIELRRIISKIVQAMETKDGTFLDFGVPYIVTATGIERRNGDHSVRLKVIPLDVSSRVKAIWAGRASVLMSGTLVDMTDGSFKYVKTSLGMDKAKELQTQAVFDNHVQQLVYVTPALKEKVDIKGAHFSLEEMVDLISATNGRSLVLFTAKVEMQHALEEIRKLQAAGKFPWRILAQEEGTNKETLKEEFTRDTHSVLFALKTFFTGVDMVGETLSLVVIAKFPLPQFNVVCKQQIAWWRGRGFPQWYERESLAVFQQAAGRLIRSPNDTGVVALLDQRAADPTQRVCQTALTGVKTLGSPVTQDLETVKKFLG